MEHNSDPIPDSPGCLNRSHLAEDLSSHSGGFLTRISLASALLLPNLLWQSFLELSLTWHSAFCKKEMAAGKHRVIHDIQQAKETVPIITCVTLIG